MITSLGDRLNSIVQEWRTALFVQGELFQLTYNAFDVTVGGITSGENDTFELELPVGWQQKQTLKYKRTYTKVELRERYEHLAYKQLSVNGIVHLVISVEAMLTDLVRAIALKYPHKIGTKRQLPLDVVLQSKTIEDLHLRATDALLNELSYKTPSEFATLVGNLLSVNLLECPAYHLYMEVKATRDILIHNRGIANETYTRKSGSHVRGKEGMQLPIDNVYFLESYEACIQLCEWLEPKLHDTFHSAAYESQQGGDQTLLPFISPEVAAGWKAEKSEGGEREGDSNHAADEDDPTTAPP